MPRDTGSSATQEEGLAREGMEKMEMEREGEREGTEKMEMEREREGMEKMEREREGERGLAAAAGGRG